MKSWEELLLYRGIVTRKAFPTDRHIVRAMLDLDEYNVNMLPIQSGKEFVLDIGAHIGCFARMWHRRNPQAEIVCVEACWENAQLLMANVGFFARAIHHAACSYHPGEVGLLNTVRRGFSDTGGSVVVPGSDLETHRGKYTNEDGYELDRRPLRKVTLEELAGSRVIDVLKLDVEGAEFDILANTTVLPHTRMIVGEFHDRERWERLRRERFSEWEYRVADREGMVFQLINMHAGKHIGTRGEVLAGR